MSERHLYIAGTGRAGTTFLVRYLTELGLETSLSRNPEAFVDSNANAGLEIAPPDLHRADAPYVVKSPWLGFVIDDILEQGSLPADGVIIPVRDLRQAAASRVILERQAALRETPWLHELKSPLPVWATIPGGLLHSLNEIDAQRILAVSFHHLVERLIREGIPIAFLHFPRFVTDSDYLYRQLAPLLPNVTRTMSLAAFESTADEAKVRTEKELNLADDVEQTLTQNAALKREIKLLRDQLNAANTLMQSLRSSTQE
jgi:hypothetical protein